MKLKFYFEQRVYADSVAVYLIGEDAHGKRFVAKSVKLEFEPIDNVVREPTFEFSGPISREFFPALVEGLARSGYQHESSDAGELKATKKHLEDMRMIAQLEARVRADST